MYPGGRLNKDESNCENEWGGREEEKKFTDEYDNKVMYIIWRCYYYSEKKGLI